MSETNAVIAWLRRNLRLAPSYSDYSDYDANGDGNCLWIGKESRQRDARWLIYAGPDQLVITAPGIILRADYADPNLLERVQESLRQLERCDAGQES